LECNGVTEVLHICGLSLAGILLAGHQIVGDPIIDLEIPVVFYFVLVDKNGGVIRHIFGKKPPFTTDERNKSL